MPNKIIPAGANSDPSYTFKKTQDGCDFYVPKLPTPPVSIVTTDATQTVITAKTGK